MSGIFKPSVLVPKDEPPLVPCVLYKALLGTFNSVPPTLKGSIYFSCWLYSPGIAVSDSNCLLFSGVTVTSESNTVLLMSTGPSFIFLSSLYNQSEFKTFPNFWSFFQ